MTAADNTVTITLPRTRTDGSALPLSQIASVVLSKAVGAGPLGIVQTTMAPASEVITYLDDSPDFGSTDNYVAVVTDVQGNNSVAGSASISVPAQPVAPPSGPSVSVVFVPAS